MELIMSENPRILVVDDEENCLRALNDVFDLEGLACLTSNNAAKALDLINHNDIDIVIADVRMPVMSGLDLLKQIKKTKPDIHVIMLTGYGSITDAVASIKWGTHQYVMKPVITEDLLLMVKEILAKIDAKEQPQPAKVSKETVAAANKIVGNSIRIQNIVKLIDRIAGTDLPVIISGESGTGKELAARVIHAASGRAQKPFVYISCAATPDSLLEGELFGYEKGAFSDARSTKTGKLEEAEGGTLFIDEIGDMKPAMQGKLLRVLEEGEYQRLGSNKPRKLQVRLLSTTNRDLRQAMIEKTFRIDLYHHLNGVTITMPPLREIAADIPILADFFIKQSASRFGRKANRISTEALAALTKYQWPGNSRELANAIQRAVALSDGQEVQIYDLPPHFAQQEIGDLVIEQEPAKSLLLEDIERDHILQVLELTSGNKSEAAQVLGIHRDTLLRKLKKYGVE